MSETGIQDASLKTGPAKPPADPAQPSGDAKAGSGPGRKRAAASPGKNVAGFANTEDGLRHLPRYARSLLKIKVPVSVTLACDKRSVAEILGIMPGALLQFNKSCDEPLELEVTNQPVAIGEAVKVGDKFGLRISQIVLPDERFHKVDKSDVNVAAATERE